MNDRILLFIPMYNCEKQIVRVLEQLTDEVCHYLSEVIVVNNCSTDGSETAAINFLKQHPLSISAKVLCNDDNYGLGGSHKVAFQYAIDNGFTHVIVLHGDDQGSIADLLPILYVGEQKRFDSILGSRFEKGSCLTNYSKFRIFGNHIFNFVVSVVARRRLTDLGSGLNVYQTSYLRNGFYLQFPDTLSFNVFMLLYGVHTESTFRFFPLSWREEDQISNAKLVRQSMEILSLIWRYLFFRKKLFSQPIDGSRQYTSKTVYQHDV